MSANGRFPSLPLASRAMSAFRDLSPKAAWQQTAKASGKRLACDAEERARTGWEVDTLRIARSGRMKIP